MADWWSVPNKVLHKRIPCSPKDGATANFLPCPWLLWTISLLICGHPLLLCSHPLPGVSSLTVLWLLFLIFSSNNPAVQKLQMRQNIKCRWEPEQSVWTALQRQACACCAISELFFYLFTLIFLFSYMTQLIVKLLVPKLFKV